MDAWVEERLSDYLDGTLSPQERAMVEAHLQTSERARASLESLRWTVSLLKQTPAPALPRQFTLPITPRAPARNAPGWMVWGLRGVAVAATAAFVILLVGTLLRQPSGGNTAMLQEAASPPPSVMIALAPTSAAPAQAPAPAQSNATDTNPAPTPIMITVEAPPAASGVVLQTQPAPFTANAPVQSQPTAKPNQAQKAPPPSPTQRVKQAQPTEAPVALESQPTDAAAAGASSAANAAPELATAPVTATQAASTQRTFDVQGIDGAVTAVRLRVRAGPGMKYPGIAVLKKDDRVRVIGRSETSDWLAIQFERDGAIVEGWVAARFVATSGQIETLPVATPGARETPEIAPPPSRRDNNTGTDRSALWDTGRGANANHTGTHSGRQCRCKAADLDFRNDPSRCPTRARRVSVFVTRCV